MTIVDLLSGNAAQARQMLAAHTPAMTREQYLKLLRGFEGEQRLPLGGA